MLRGGLVLIWELDMNLEPTLVSLDIQKNVKMPIFPKLTVFVFFD